MAVTDPFGNIANSPWTTVTVAAHGTDSKYVKAVYASQPTSYWRFGETTGATAADRVGSTPGDLRGSGVTKGAAGAIAGDADKAATVQRRRTGIAYTDASWSARRTRSRWKAGSRPTPRTGGKLFGFGDKQTSNSSQLRPPGLHGQLRQDRLRGLPRRDGHGQQHRDYRNNAWHHVVATLSPSGMKLYVDGALVGQRATTDNTAQSGYWGYWRIGGDNLSSWPSEADQQLLQGQSRRGGALPP